MGVAPGACFADAQRPPGKRGARKRPSRFCVWCLLVVSQLPRLFSAVGHLASASAASRRRGCGCVCFLGPSPPVPAARVPPLVLVCWGRLSTPRSGGGERRLRRLSPSRGVALRGGVIPTFRYTYRKIDTNTEKSNGVPKVRYAVYNMV